MKTISMAAASGLALSLFLAAPVMAQNARVDANGMPSDDSTPAEKAETARMNNQVAAGNAAIDAQAATNNAQYQQQQQDYQERLKLNRAAQQDYQNQVANYDAVRARYASERAAYRRGAWPARYTRWVVQNPEDKMIGERVELISGTPVGTVADVDLTASNNIDALLVRLDGGKLVWIDSGDVRYNRADGIVMTNLDRRDLHHMADQRL